MANKKHVTKLAVLSLLGMLGLTACGSEVIAKPEGYSTDTIVELTDSEGKDVTVFGNLMKDIYDDIREGSLASDVLNKLLYQYSISVLGRYNKVISDKDVSTSEADNGITLKLAARYAKNAARSADETAKLNEFIRDHKAYWSVNADGKRVNENNEVIADDTLEAGEKEIARVSSKWDAIEERIAEAVYTKVTNAAYKERGLFLERKLLKDFRISYYNVETYIGKETEEVFTKGSGKLFKGLISSDVLEKDVFDNFLHREYLQSNYSLDEDESADEEYNYIEKEIIPDVYRQLLVEQYLFDEAYYTLGRSAARKINVITISPNDNAKYSYANSMLMNKFVKDYIFAYSDSDNYQVIYGSNSVDPVKDAFDRISDIWKGVDLASYDASSSDALDKMGATLRDFLIANNVLGAQEEIEGHKFYKGTEYGDLMEQYGKIDANPNLTDSSAESKFTGSGTYSKSIGLEMETNNVITANHVTSGWFIKDSANLSTLPSAIKTRLFHNVVASSLDRKITKEDGSKEDDTSTDRFYTEGGVEKYDSSRDYNHKSGNDYVARIHGKYFLTTTKSESKDPTTISPEDILFVDGTNYYIVEIQEAVNSTKLSKTSASNYSSLYDNDKMEDVVNSVAGEIAQGDSYSTLSKSHWLEEMNLEYHDQVVYDYFKSNFPDLFD